MPAETEIPPGEAKLRTYIYSLPERLVRSIAGLGGGVILEVGDVLLPARVRRSRLYDSLVGSTLRFLVEQVGQIEAPSAEGAEPLPPDFLIRRTAGNVVELAGIASFRASPVWVLAALSDLAGAGRELISEIGAALIEERLLDPGREFHTVEQLLDGLERTTGRLTETVNTPPLDVAALRAEWTEIRAQAARFPPASIPVDRLRSQWRELKETAAEQGRPVVQVASAVALAAVRELPDNVRWLSRAARVGGRRAGEVLGGGLLDHYQKSLGEIRDAGYLNYWLREFQPYWKGALAQFSSTRPTITQRLLTRRRRTAKNPPSGA